MTVDTALRNPDGLDHFIGKTVKSVDTRMPVAIGVAHLRVTFTDDTWIDVTPCASAAPPKMGHALCLRFENGAQR